MFKYKKRNMNKTFILLLLVLGISIGYAALTTVLKINSEISLGRVTFAIHFDNVQQTNHKATVVEDAHIIDEDKKEISFNIGLARISDNYKFTTDIVNEGTIPGKVKSIEILGLTESQKRLIKYDVYYTGTNRIVSVGDFFGPNSSKNVTVEVTYYLSDDVTNDDLPTDTLNLECQFIINFENGDLSEFRSRAASNKLSQSTLYMSSASLHFDQSANDTEHEGVYVIDSTLNDDFPIYFYRGSATTPNHVIFAGYCWRIIRTTNTGGIKIIYNGTPTDEGYCTNTTGADTKIRDARYGETQNYGTSDIRNTLESWYFDHIIRYQEYLEDLVLCNDTSYSNGVVSLTCQEGKEYSLAKGNISYPIGLISAQEANLCGMSRNMSNYPWLYTNDIYWTVSGKYNYSQHVWGIRYDKIYPGLADNGTNSDGGTLTTHGVRPVISLNSEVELSEGNGTSTNPYKVSLQ